MRYYYGAPELSRRDISSKDSNKEEPNKLVMTFDFRSGRGGFDPNGKNLQENMEKFTFDGGISPRRIPEVFVSQERAERRKSSVDVGVAHLKKSRAVAGGSSLSPPKNNTSSMHTLFLNDPSRQD